MRWQSRKPSVFFDRHFTTGAPKVRLGTKWPSMMSKCSQSAPPSSTLRLSDSMLAKSEASREGEILAAGAMAGSAMGEVGDDAR